MDIIYKDLNTGSNMRVVSDGWAASTFSPAQKGYQHSVVVHKEEFKNASQENKYEVNIDPQ